jgi:hypothetical protein
MLVHDAITQPTGRSNLDLVADVIAAQQWDALDVAAAYATISGVRVVLHKMTEVLGADWEALPKRWVVGFDYCRSDPLALKMLNELPNSIVKIPDAARVLATPRCVPRRPFHPKTFIFRGNNHSTVFSGSGNLSRSGMTLGHEVGLLIGSKRPARNGDAPVRAKIAVVSNWYEALWQGATTLDTPLLEEYQAVFESVPNLRFPTPTDDDPPISPTKRRALTTEDLRKLRACRHFWIEAGNVTKNLGPHRPGNQLMMTPLTRVFFGVPATGVPQNTPLRHIELQFDENNPVERSLTFSDNGMDKLTLPMPGQDGPPKYDKRTLLFTRVGPRNFRLELGAAGEKRLWIQQSKAIDAFHVMPSQGRKWGVF